MNTNNFVVYDVETAKVPDEVEGGWSNPEGMGFSCATLYEYERDLYQFFLGPKEIEDLLNLLEYRWAITFNGIQFDSRVLLGNDREVSNLSYTTTSSDGKHAWKNYDILFEYVKSRWELSSFVAVLEKLQDKSIHDGTFTLDGLCKAMFNLGKTGDGALAPVLAREGKISQLLGYNLRDVQLTKKLFDFIVENGYVFGLDGKVVRLPWRMTIGVI